MITTMAVAKRFTSDRKEYLPCRKEELEHPKHGFPCFTRPVEIFNFSMEDHRKIVFDQSRRKIYLPPNDVSQLQYDLNKGYETHIPKIEKSEFLNNLLEAILHAKLIGTSDFVCWRGLLTKIASTPYEAGNFAEGWIILAMKVNGTVYLCDCQTEEAKANEANKTDRNKLMSYWGHKFESYVTANPESEHRSSNGSTDINLNEEYVSVVNSSINGIKILFGGEVDCCYENDRRKYVELKTTRGLSSNSYSFRRYKLIKWWLQSFLLGIEDIICGNRDDNGIVRSLQTYKVSEIPNTVKYDIPSWKPAGCFNFLSNFLKFAQNHVTEEQTVYVFTKKLENDFVEMTTSQDADYLFIPKWFLSKAKSSTEDFDTNA